MAIDLKVAIAMIGLVLGGAMDANRSDPSAGKFPSAPSSDDSFALSGVAPLAGPSAWDVRDCEDMPVHEIRLIVRTDDRDAAETRDAILVRLNDEAEIRLAGGSNDLQRGATSTIDLSQDEISGHQTVCTLADIQRLEIVKAGVDGWCFSDIELIVNGRTLVQIHYPRGQWLDNAGGARLIHTISGDSLRSSAKWPN
jgi:hypothetical protein